jgi:hypothetical protein
MPTANKPYLPKPHGPKRLVISFPIKLPEANHFVGNLGYFVEQKNCSFDNGL